MFYVDNQKYDLTKLNPAKKGDTIWKRDLSGWEVQVVAAWEEIIAKIAGNKDKRIIFRLPHIGSLTKHQGGSYPRSTTVYDSSGSHQIVWCNNAVTKDNGGFEYFPKSKKYEKATYELNPEKDIEEILWNICFAPLSKQTTMVMENGKPVQRPKLYMVDDDKDAADYLSEISRSGAAIQYLTLIPQYYEDENFVNYISLLYEISKPELLANAVKRQKLLKIITDADAKGDKERGSDFFIKCKNDYDEGDAYSDLLTVVQKAFDRNIIGLNQQEFKVYLKGSGNTNLGNLWSCPPNDMNRWKKGFARWLMNHPDKAEILNAGIEEKPITPREQKKFYLPQNLTEDWFRNKESDGGMNWNDMKSLVALLPGIDVNAVKNIKRPEAANICITYFIREQKTIAPELIKNEP